MKIEDICEAWETHSASRCAGWLFLNKDPKENVRIIEEVVDSQIEDEEYTWS